MRILLIDPPYERFIGFRAEWFPQGIASIAAYLRSLGHTVAAYHAEHGQDTEYKSIVNYAQNFDRYRAAIEDDNHPVWQETKRVIMDFHPDILGISVLTPKVPSASKICRIAKSISSKVIVVLGGHHPTIFPEEMLKNADVDFVVRGEGEITFSELAENFSRGKTNFSQISGLSFIQDSKVVNTADRELVSNLDSLPFPARDALVDLETYTPTQLSMIMASRGCPFKCGFCASRNLWGRRVRFRSIDNVLAEIKELRDKYGVKNITLMDDSFTLKKEQVKKFCHGLLGEHLDITWSCLTRVDIVSDDIIALMKKSGCRKVDIGIESGNQRVLDLIFKDITLSRVREAVKILRRNRIFWSGFFMIGFPTETEKEIFDTLDFLRELRPDWANISIFTPYPGTPLYELAREKGMVSAAPDYTRYSHQNTFLRSTDTIPEERFMEIAAQVLREVHEYNSSYRSLFKRALTRDYHKNPLLLLHDARKVLTWLKR